MLGAIRKCAPSSWRAMCSASRLGRTEFARSSFTISAHTNILRATTIRSISQSTSLRNVAQPVEKDERDESSNAAARSSSTVQFADGIPTKFSELGSLGVIHPNLISTLNRDMGIEDMTEVQSKSLDAVLKGVDIIAQAKTGTGKTVAFLLPLLQRIIQEDPSLATPKQRRARAHDIRAIVISPTRELAEQIGVEAIRMTRGTAIKVQTAVGGTMKNNMLRKIQWEGCHLLVATPGRLRDLLSDDFSGVKAPLLSALVLDEADRLLDAGFLAEIEEIKNLLPNPLQRDRQSLMFSATVPPEIVNFVRSTLRPGFKFVQCVKPDESPTHENVPQVVAKVRGLENRIPAMLELCCREIQKSAAGESRPFKAMVFFSSTAEVSLAHSLVRNLRDSQGKPLLYPVTVLEIHGKLTQSQRTRASETFRRSTSAILFTSDVTARGMDFPDVTHIIQVGLPQDRNSYIHRLGRTGRAGKEGQGWLIIGGFEKEEARRRLRNLPIKNDDSLQVADVDLGNRADVPAEIASLLDALASANKRIDPEAMKLYYMAALGTFQFLDKHVIAEVLNKLVKNGWNMPAAPAIPQRLAQKLGLMGGLGFNITREGIGGMSNDGGSRRRPAYSSAIDPFSDDTDPFASRQPSQTFNASRTTGEDPYASRRASFPDRQGGRGSRGFDSRPPRRARWNSNTR